MVSCPESHPGSSVCSSLPAVLPSSAPTPGRHSGPPRASGLSAGSGPAGVRGLAPPLPPHREQLRACPHSQLLKQIQPARKLPALPRPLGRTARVCAGTGGCPWHDGAALPTQTQGSLRPQSGIPAASGSTVKKQISGYKQPTEKMCSQSVCAILPGSTPRLARTSLTRAEPGPDRAGRESQPPGRQGTPSLRLSNAAAQQKEACRGPNSEEDARPQLSWPCPVPSEVWSRALAASPKPRVQPSLAHVAAVAQERGSSEVRGGARSGGEGSGTEKQRSGGEGVRGGEAEERRGGVRGGEAEAAHGAEGRESGAALTQSPYQPGTGHHRQPGLQAYGCKRHFSGFLKCMQPILQESKSPFEGRFSHETGTNVIYIRGHLHLPSSRFYHQIELEYKYT